MRKVVSISEKLEQWNDAYCSFEHEIKIHVSNHGRIKLQLGNKISILEFVESVKLLSHVAEKMNFNLMVQKQKNDSVKSQ